MKARLEQAQMEQERISKKWEGVVRERTGEADILRRELGRSKEEKQMYKDRV